MPDTELSVTRRELHWLLDHIPDSGVSAAHRHLSSSVDPVALSLLSAQYDDEGETEEERADVEAARRELGAGMPHEEVVREFGL